MTRRQLAVVDWGPNKTLSVLEEGAWLKKRFRPVITEDMTRTRGYKSPEYSQTNHIWHIGLQRVSFQIINRNLLQLNFIPLSFSHPLCFHIWKFDIRTEKSILPAVLTQSQGTLSWRCPGTMGWCVPTLELDGVQSVVQGVDTMISMVGDWFPNLKRCSVSRSR
jgi:hypothetical protein